MNEVKVLDKGGTLGIGIGLEIGSGLWGNLRMNDGSLTRKRMKDKVNMAEKNVILNSWVL